MVRTVTEITFYNVRVISLCIKNCRYLITTNRTISDLHLIIA